MTPELAFQKHMAEQHIIRLDETIAALQNLPPEAIDATDLAQVINGRGTSVCGRQAIALCLRRLLNLNHNLHDRKEWVA